MSRQMDRIVRDAITEGLLGNAVASPPADERHWSVVAFTAFAAWLSALPLLGVILGLGFLSESFEAIGFLIGTPILAASVLVLRAQRLPLFVEQLGVPGLLVGAGLVAFQTIMLTGSERMIFGVLIIVACGVTVLVPQAWVRTLMGAAIGVLTALNLMVLRDSIFPMMSPRLPWSLVACVWLVLQIVQRSTVLNAESAPRVARLEAVSSGIAAAALAGVIWSSPTFLVGDVFGHLFRSLQRDAYDGGTMRGLAVVLALSGGTWLARCWPALRTAWYAILLGLCAFLAWCLPALGAALLILFVCVESKRYALASFAGMATFWLIGGLYDDFQSPLAHKALVLGGAGVLLALMGRFALPPDAVPAEPQVDSQVRPARPDKRTQTSFLLSGLLVLGIVNGAIWQKEQLIKTGTAVFVALAPVDPRSLMQGDYMSLRFAMPTYEPDGADEHPFIPRVVARSDERGIAQLLRYHNGKTLANGEFLIDLTRKHGDWIFVTDAWYFKEGDALRWSKARYGEFRLQPDGKALLVGLRGPNLEKL